MLARIQVSTNLLEERQDFKLRYHVNRVNSQLVNLKTLYTNERVEFKKQMDSHREINKKNRN